MDNISRRFATFVVKANAANGEGTWFFIRSSYGRDKLIESTSIEVTSDISQAGFVNPDDAEFVVRLQQRLVDRWGEEGVRYVTLSQTVTLVDIPFNEGEYLDERRKLALAKLRPDEIQILNLGQLATYNKLKFYKNDENSNR